MNLNDMSKSRSLGSRGLPLRYLISFIRDEKTLMFTFNYFGYWFICSLD